MLPQHVHLAAGERYAGVAPADGAWHHLVLAAVSSKLHDWASAEAWAIEAGGRLPNRAELGVLLATAELPNGWYWAERVGDTRFALLGCMPSSLVTTFRTSWRGGHACAVRRAPLIPITTTGA